MSALSTITSTLDQTCRVTRGRSRVDQRAPAARLQLLECFAVLGFELVIRAAC